MRGPAVAFVLLLAGCAAPAAPDPLDGCFPQHSFAGTLDAPWESVTNGSLTSPAGWPLPLGLAPAPATALRSMHWRPDGGDPTDVLGEFRVSDGDYQTPPVFTLEWPWGNNEGPVLHVRYDKDVPIDNVRNDTKAFLSMVGFPSDPAGFIDRFVATRQAEGSGLIMVDRKTGSTSTGPDVAASYRLAWEDPSPVPAALRESRGRAGWLEGTLVDGDRSYVADFAMRSFREENATASTSVSVSSNRAVHGWVSNINATVDAHGQVVAALARLGLPLSGLTVSPDDLSAWCPSAAGTPSPN